jgi:mannose-1-phosphate guanylyltransferase/mannose-6-phosphate isomerase
MSGGSGTRLWPVSRQTFPKQLLPIAGNVSMLRETAERLVGSLFDPPVVVGGEEHRFFIKRQLETAGIAVEAILLEPEGRNTAAAAALAAEWLRSRGGDEILLLTPSDHVIGDRATFEAAIQTGMPRAEAGGIVTFGIRPNHASTQYGYIEVDGEIAAESGARPIVCFVEKPNASMAAQYLASGRFLWNSGIFLVKASTLIEEMQRFLPASLECISSAVGGASVDGLFVRPLADAFRKSESISIDNGIMEKTDRGFVVPVEMDWSDVGSWSAVWEISAKDQANNVTQGAVVAIDTRNSLLRSDGTAVIATLGLENMAVIAVRDAVLVAPFDRVGEVKLVVDQLQNQTRDCVVSPSKVARPWGSYETVDSGPRFQIKHIIVDPGETLSLQKHFHRSEHWIVVRGTAEVTVGDEVILLQENESTYIPAGTRHRLANPGKVPLELVEVQCGTYLGEDDIIRFEDEYGRR